MAMPSSLGQALWLPEANPGVRVRARAAFAGVTLFLVARGTSPTGLEWSVQSTLGTVGASFTLSTIAPLQPGWLLSLGVTATPVPVAIGVIYATVEVVEDSPAGPISFGVLTQGWVGSDGPLAWSSTTGQPPATAGPGASHSAPANPAPGQEFTQAFGSLARLALHGVAATLTTSAAAGNRVPGLALAETGGVVHMLWAPASLSVPPSSTRRVYWSPGAPEAAFGTQAILVPFQRFESSSGLTVSSRTLNLDSGDQWSDIRITRTQSVGV